MTSDDDPVTTITLPASSVREYGDALSAVLAQGFMQPAHYTPLRELLSLLEGTEAEFKEVE